MNRHLDGAVAKAFRNENFGGDFGNAIINFGNQETEKNVLNIKAPAPAAVPTPKGPTF